MNTYTFVSCSILLLMSSVTYKPQQCLAQQFLFGPPEMTTSRITTTTRSKDKAVTIPPTTTMPPSRPTVPTNDTMGMETESNITLGNNNLSCSQVINITSNNTTLHFRIPPMNSTVHCVITIHGQRDQQLLLQLTNISLPSGMFDCEQGAIQLYTFKHGLLYFKSRSCNSTDSPLQLITENNVAVLTVTLGNSRTEQHFELEVQSIDANNEGYGYQYGPSGTSFGLPSIAYISDDTFEPPNLTYDYVPSGENYGPPRPTYGPPTTTYRPPRPTHGPPSYTYGPPRPTHGPPSYTYGPPRPTHGPPSYTYGPPRPTHGPPSYTYGPPRPTHGPPSYTYGPPRPTHGPPSYTYGPPRPTYGPPKPTHVPPTTTYRPPRPTYGPPSYTYGPPRPTYGPPNTTYGPPNATFGPPNATYGPPNATYSPSGGPSYHSTYNLGNYSSFLRETLHLGDSIDRHYNPIGDYGYEYSSPPEYEHNTHNYNGYTTPPSPPPYDGYEYHCANDCDKQPWKVINSISYQGDSSHDPYSSPLYAWLTSGTKPKYWSNELH